MDNSPYGSRAVSKFVRLTPRKARTLLGVVRKRNVVEALNQLQFIQSKPARWLYKTLKSAVHNAENNLNLNRESLVVLEAKIDEGPRLKRSKSKNKGGRHPIIKRTSHVTVVVGEDE
ncbi:MAG: 50S ribosomal protein L22 [Chlamydiia bacterium]|nr:50S ribosomal protein L22 [Chlamydiia bacterium]